MTTLQYHAVGRRKEAAVLCIGPAGENLVRFACVANELKHVNGRTGMGAVMGSKNLKAVAVRPAAPVGSPVASGAPARRGTPLPPRQH